MLRQHIVSLFPQQITKKYIEVFGGAGWVLFQKDQIKGQTEIFNDLDSNLVNLFRCIKYHNQALVQEIESINIQSREVFKFFAEQLKSGWLTDIQRAAVYFYLVKYSFGNNERNFATAPKSIENATKRLQDIQNRLKNVIIENKDFASILKLYDGESSLFFLDPPYHGTEKYYSSIFSLEDHYRLHECLKTLKGKFILTYNDDEFIRELYNEYTFIEVSRSSTLAANATGEKQFCELIIKNY